MQNKIAEVAVGQRWRVSSEDSPDAELLKPFMTVVAAIQESSTSLLIGADTGVHELGTDLKLSESRKLRQHPSAPLAWGVSGNLTLGVEDFGGWVSRYVWPPKDWNQFRYEAAEHLVKLNGRQRKLIKTAGAKPTDDDVARALFAGWLGKTPIIFAIRANGNQEVISDQSFFGVGSGYPFALVAYTALTLSAEMENPDAFTKSLYIAATLQRYCDPPINIWRVTPSGVEHVLVEFGSAKNSPLKSPSESFPRARTQPGC